jgi:predicted ABC-type ATPase
MPEKKPTFYMLVGPNGAGKSTLYETVIKPRDEAPFINADIIQKNELKNPSMSASYEAAKIAEERRQEYLSVGKSFVSESTFSHPSKLELIKQAKQANFRVVVYHVNVRSPNLSVSRVGSRVKDGGHNVPEEKIRERYERNQPLIREAALIADKAFVYDNSVIERPPKLQISFTQGKVNRVAENIPSWARNLYAKELEPYSLTRLNPAAASYDDAKKMAEKILGQPCQVAIPQKGKSYQGEIVGETALHILQRSPDQKIFTAHFKYYLNKEIRPGQKVEINYRLRSQAQVKSLTNVQSQKASLAQGEAEKKRGTNVRKR